MHVLFTGKARSWFWRYHKQVDRIVWSNICASLRQQYKDYRSDFMSMELIKARKRKHGEPFSSFYEAVASLIDKASIKIATRYERKVAIPASALCRTFTSFSSHERKFIAGGKLSLRSG